MKIFATIQFHNIIRFNKLCSKIYKTKIYKNNKLHMLILLAEKVILNLHRKFICAQVLT